MALIIVQPEDHGRVLGQLDEQLPVVPHAVVAEHLDLAE